MDRVDHSQRRVDPGSRCRRRLGRNRGHDRRRTDRRRFLGAVCPVGGTEFNLLNI